MNVKKFTAQTSRDAMILVKETLGRDAIILSNRTVDGRVEILAVAGDEMAMLSSPVSASRDAAVPHSMAPAASTTGIALGQATQSQQPITQPMTMQAMPSNMQTSAAPTSMPANWMPQPTNPQMMYAHPQAMMSMPMEASMMAPQMMGMPVHAAVAQPIQMGMNTNVPAQQPVMMTPARTQQAVPQASPVKAAPPKAAPAKVVKVAAKATVKTAAAKPVSKVAAKTETEKVADNKATVSTTRQASDPGLLRTEKNLVKVMSEIRSMRSMFETQLAEIRWGARQQHEPVKAALLRDMLDTGFSASMARYVVENLPPCDDHARGIRWIQSALASNLNVMDDEEEMLRQGGVFALVGPTGVGKTTTTAKLAARCVMAHGPSKLALISTDGYRVGGYEQLRIYGKILGVMVHSVRDEADLRLALSELKNKHIILIDTIGVSQRDKMVTEQAAMLSSAGTEIKRLLCLSATSTAETLNEVVKAYKNEHLAGCIMTKVDEAVTVGNLLDVIIRQKMKLYYMANGQRVPEDLHQIQPQTMIEQAFTLRRDRKIFQFEDHELPMIVANAGRGAGANRV